MATFPAALASLPRPTAQTKRNAPGFEGHALQNQLADEIEAIQAAIGVSGSAVSGTVEKRLTDTQQAAASHAAAAAPHSGHSTPASVAAAISAHEGDADAHPGYTKLRSDLVDRVIAHRGGAALWPENSMSAFRAAVASGIKHIEIDCYLLADGQIGCMHDSTVDRTTSGTGNTEAFSGAAFSALAIDPGTFMGWGSWPAEAPPLLPDVLDTLAVFSWVTLWIEGKNTGSVEAVLCELQRRNFPADKVILQTASQLVLAIAKAAGYQILYLVDPSTVNLATVADLGATHIGYSSFSAQKVIDVHASGMGAVQFTINRRDDADDAFENGVDYIFSDDPLWVSRLTAQSTRSTFYGGRYKPGDFPSAGVPNVPGFSAGALRWSTMVAGYVGQLQGWACPIGGNEHSNSYTITLNLAFTAVNSDDRWAGFMVCAQTDRVFADAGAATLVAGYHILVRRTGQTQIYRQDLGAVALLLQSVSYTTLALNTPHAVIITITATSVSVKVGASATNTVTDSTHRGGYVHFGRSGCAIDISNVIIT